MTKQQKKQYQPTEALRQVLNILNQQKFVLDCGHHITFNQVLGNDITIRNGKELQITCSECGY
ncbi:hypothetical protein [Desulfogranum marinum]|uniref:hypothetical protein n=1 Tax=Desulfogranum marinum TaxID=453220 RepID=UPI0019630111|nr:hypothetical protein [Desulfogranum marinum]MBM9512021.1 hypothetical protein [Desulfogranum marinum]